MELTITDCNIDTISIEIIDEKLYSSYADASKLFSTFGLKLGNYHYKVERNETSYGIEVCLKRCKEECKFCPLLDMTCDGYNPPAYINLYPCSKMLQVYPYDDNYSFMSENEIDNYNEFSSIEKLALSMIWLNKDILKKINH